MFKLNFADDLWYWKRPLYQLSHNHFPYLHIVCHYLKSAVFWFRLKWGYFIISTIILSIEEEEQQHQETLNTMELIFWRNEEA